MRLNQVTVTVSDIERAIDFYTRLGLTLIVKSPHYVRFECPDGGSTFSAHIGPVVAGTTVVYFECDDLDATFARLSAAGVAFTEAPADKTWLWREARLEDPDGNLLCLFNAGENRRHPPWRVTNDT